MPPLTTLGEQSVDGTMQYAGNAFNGALNNAIVMTGYATGRVIAVSLSADGQSVTTLSTIMEGLSKPLPIIEGQTPTGSPDGTILVGLLMKNEIDLLTPVTTGGTGAWTFVAPMPTGRRTMAVGLLNGDALLMGGERTSSGGAFPENEQYDPLANTWTTLTPMKTQRQGASYGTINGEVYVAGGGVTGGSSFSNILEGFHF